ncbi:MAG: hypothetical protein NTV52_09265 [Acidobacteria bacterium]|nr:hypothetical protein [Acidobacteriota bacterium]
MRILLLFLCVTTGIATAEPIAPHHTVQYTAPRDGLLHASLHRAYSQLPANLEIQSLSEELRSLVPENTQTHPGRWTFRAGLVRQGVTYSILSSEPGELNLQLLPAPDAQNPHKAITAGASWLIRAADAWLSNQPRHGAIEQPDQAQHPEARACIACHVTQFTTRGYLTAARNGHDGQAPQALANVMQRLRDNPRPLYGHDGVNWARVIYSARTVSSRLPVLLNLHRQATASQPAEDRALTLGAARFLLLADDCGAAALRPEADGSRPDVSAFEIGLQTWETFQLAAAAEPHNPVWPQKTACIAQLLSTTKPTNTIDAAWRIVALTRLHQPTATAIAELLRHQQPDGRFGLALSNSAQAAQARHQRARNSPILPGRSESVVRGSLLDDAPPADFISYHVLYALAVAKHRGPATDRLAAYTLRQQRPDGSWKGAPEYKGFDTPFRETQFAVMALSELHRQPAHPLPALLATGPRPQPDPWQNPDRPALQQQLLARMKLESSPALVDALAATLDENLAQLREWQRSIRLPENQARVEAALRADSQRQATLLSNALNSGPRPQRLQILQALAKVPGVAGFPPRPRVGNDLEAPQILADANQALEQALLACLPDPALAEAAIRAATALGDTLTPYFTLALLRDALPLYGPTVEDSFAPGRRGRLSLTRDNQYPEALATLLTSLLRQQNPTAHRILLPLLANLEPDSRLTRDVPLQAVMERLLRDHPNAEVLRASAAFPNIADAPLMRTQVLEAMASPDVALVQAAVEVAVERFVTNPNLNAMTTQFFKHAQGPARRMLLDGLDPARVRFRLDLVLTYRPPPFEIPADANILGLESVQEFVLSSLRHPDPLVRAAALDLTRKHDRLRRNPNIHQALAQPTAPRQLDFAFFRDRIQPLLERPAADGRSCIMCHAANARFPLRADAQANFHAASRKVNRNDPAESPLLIKPLLPGVTSDGDVFRTSHNGGERWPARTGSVEYQTILEWIRGSRQ